MSITPTFNMSLTEQQMQAVQDVTVRNLILVAGPDQQSSSLLVVIHIQKKSDDKDNIYVARLSHTRSTRVKPAFRLSGTDCRLQIDNSTIRELARSMLEHDRDFNDNDQQSVVSSSTSQRDDDSPPQLWTGRLEDFCTSSQSLLQLHPGGIQILQSLFDGKCPDTRCIDGFIPYARISDDEDVDRWYRRNMNQAVCRTCLGSDLRRFDEKFLNVSLSVYTVGSSVNM